MTLPSSGTITLNQVNTELGNSATASINMGSSAVRGLFDKASGAVAMSDGHGKANAFNYVISSNTKGPIDINTVCTAAGWDGSSNVVFTINSGVYVWVEPEAHPRQGPEGHYGYALAVTNHMDNKLVINNYGKIIGHGFGLAVYHYLSHSIRILAAQGITINNMSGAYIAGGGGAGGYGSHGGGGGGAGGWGVNRGGTGGAFGAPGQAGGEGTNWPNNYSSGGKHTRGQGGGAGGGSAARGGGTFYYSGGGGGGRILPGVGGLAQANSSWFSTNEAGSAGGSANNTGTSHVATNMAGGGGGWGAYGGSGTIGAQVYGGMPGSKAIHSYPHSYTLNNSGTIYGGT